MDQRRAAPHSANLRLAPAELVDLGHRRPVGRLRERPRGDQFIKRLLEAQGALGRDLGGDRGRGDNSCAG